MKIDMERIIRLLIGLIIGLCFLVLIISSMNSAKEDLEICKELGYDGIRFKNKFNSEIECANFTDLEKEKFSQKNTEAKK